ncbi:MAG: hypothetical protein QOE96_3546 [Blastocatellia bacterium]|jgi:hypothetical protein|nr:hypothetical protein [Blastocatellia bacterium]
MSERIVNILNSIKTTGLPDYLKEFQQISEDTFDLQTTLSDFSHQTRLSFNGLDSAYLWIYLTHLFGYLDPLTTTEHLQHILSLNNESYNGSGAFIAVAHNTTNNIFQVTLRSHQIFLTKWRDEEIADAVATLLYNILVTVGISASNAVRAFDVSEETDESLVAKMRNRYGRS